jgi:hypothetical protein
MLEPPSSSILLPYPRVRDACQSYHRRKIRCLLTPGSPACQSCLASGELCLFAPRAKAGRPRRTHSEKLQRRKLSWPAADNDYSRTSSESRHARSSTESIVMVAADELQFGNMAFNNYWDPEKMARIQGLGDISFLTHLETPAEANNIMDVQKLRDADFLTHNTTPRWERCESLIVLDAVQHKTPPDGRKAQMVFGGSSVSND